VSWLIAAAALAFSGASSAYERKPMDTQIVVQWEMTAPPTSDRDPDAVKQWLESYFSAEDVINDASGDLFFEDGNDVGGGVFNVFVYSDRVDETVQRIIALDKAGKFPPGTKIGVAVYTDPSHKDWTFRAAYPADLTTFLLSPDGTQSKDPKAQ
jgi:hypothetical protein